MNNLIGVKINKQKGLKFPKGIFYKPETKIKLSNKLNYKPTDNSKSKGIFNINLNKAPIKIFLINLKKKLSQVKHIR